MLCCQSLHQSTASGGDSVCNSQCSCTLLYHVSLIDVYVCVLLGWQFHHVLWTSAQWTQQTGRARWQRPIIQGLNMSLWYLILHTQWMSHVMLCLWFQRTTNRKWPMEDQMVTWPMIWRVVSAQVTLVLCAYYINCKAQFISNACWVDGRKKTFTDCLSVRAPKAAAVHTCCVLWYHL